MILLLSLSLISANPEATCLAKVIHHESANQPLQGQIGVGYVVKNRVKSPKFPNSYCAVVKQKGQFFYPNSYNPKDKRWATSVKVAQGVMNGTYKNPVGPSLFFQTTWSRSQFFRTRTFIVRIADHNFYK